MSIGDRLAAVMYYRAPCVCSHNSFPSLLVSREVFEPLNIPNDPTPNLDASFRVPTLLNHPKQLLSTFLEDLLSSNSKH